MSREWVKCRFGPRISQSPWSGSSQWVAELPDQRLLHRPGLRIVLQAPAARLLERDHDLTENVGLTLPHGAVPDAHRRRRGIPRQVRQRTRSGSLPGPVHPVHDLQVLWVAGDGAQQPVAPEPRLGEIPRRQQRLQGERGVAQPAEPVVPVAHAPDVLGQARRGCGNDPAVAGVGEQAQGEQRADDLVAVGPSYVQCPAHSFERRTVAAIWASTCSGGGTALCDWNHVVVKVCRCPAEMSNSSTWWPSWRWGRREPRRTSMSGPAIAVMTSVSRRCPGECETQGRTLP